MEVSVTLLSDQGNYAVLKLPERRFPGVLFQGDSLASVYVDVVEAYELAVKLGSPTDLVEQIEGVRDRLREVVERYEGVLAKAKLELPYPRRYT